MHIVDFIHTNQQYFEDFITRSTYHSNAIEGNTLSFAETYAILFNDNSLSIKAQPREIYEAINHKYALSYILDHIQEPLSQQMIIDIAVQINKNISEISGIRTTQVFIKGAEHIPPAPVNLPQRMMYFVHNYNNTTYDSVFQKIATNHIEFEQMHPFSDGNGRTGRLIINYELLKNNLPPIVIPQETRTDYFNLIAQADVTGLSNFFKDLYEFEKERISTFEKADIEELDR